MIKKPLNILTLMICCLGPGLAAQTTQESQPLEAVQSALAVHGLMTARSPIADPVFDRSDARFTTPVTETNDETQPQAIALNNERTLEHLAEQSNDKVCQNRRLVIPRLPFTRQEADHSVREFDLGLRFMGWR